MRVAAGFLLLLLAPPARPQGTAREARLAFLGDSGTGGPEQMAVRDQLLRFQPPLVFLLGDNIYDRGSGSLIEARVSPILRKHRVDVVFAGHQHFYARMLPQKGIRYFVSGGGGRLVYPPQPAPGYVAVGGGFYHFVYVRVTEEAFEYYVIDSQGRSRDAGRFVKGAAFDEPLPEGALPPPWTPP